MLRFGLRGSRGCVAIVCDVLCAVGGVGSEVCQCVQPAPPQAAHELLQFERLRCVVNGVREANRQQHSGAMAREA